MDEPIFNQMKKTILNRRVQLAVKEFARHGESRHVTIERILKTSNYASQLPEGWMWSRHEVRVNMRTFQLDLNWSGRTVAIQFLGEVK